MSEMLIRRVHAQASADHIRWSDIQQSAQITNCGFAAVFNLGTAVSNGFDLALRVAASDNLRLGLQLAYTDAHYTSTEGGIVSAGEVIGGPAISTGTAVPPWTISANGEYTFRLLDKDAYVWLEDAYHKANTGPFPGRHPVSGSVLPSAHHRNHRHAPLLTAITPDRARSAGQKSQRFAPVVRYSMRMPW